VEELNELRMVVPRFNQRMSRLPLSGQDREEISNALLLMIDLHLDQARRPDGRLFICHPIEVALQTADFLKGWNFEGSEYKLRDLVIAALLHDSVEDQLEKLAGNRPVSNDELRLCALEEIENRFGLPVARLVAMVTKPESAHQNHEAHLEFLRGIAGGDPYAFVIKMADFCSNGLKIAEVPEEERKEKLRRKDGPAILMLIDRLKNLEDSGHPLFSHRESLLRRLRALYRREHENLSGPQHLTRANEGWRQTG